MNGKGHKSNSNNDRLFYKPKELKPLTFLFLKAIHRKSLSSYDKKINFHGTNKLLFNVKLLICIVILS